VTVTPMTTPRAAFGLAAIGSKLYAVGGYPAVGGSTAATFLASAEALDTVAGGGWEAVTPMTTPRAAFGLAAIGNKLYAAGGITNMHNLSTLASVEVFDTQVGGSWVQIAPMITARAYFGLAAIGNKLYAAGGGTLRDDWKASVEVFDTQTGGSWKQIAPMTTTRAYLSLAAVGNILYAAGGCDDTACKSVEALDTNASVLPWTIVAPMTEPRYEHSLTAIGNKLYAVGGAKQTGTSDNFPLASTETLNTGRRSTMGIDWEQIAPMTYRRFCFGLAAVGNMLYAAGGTDSYNTFVSVEVLDTAGRSETASAGWEK